MPTNFTNYIDDEYNHAIKIKRAEHTWDFDEQIEAIERWFKKNKDYDFSEGVWVIDIGFKARSKSAVSGYTINVNIMKTLSKKNITLWLSDYSKTDDVLESMRGKETPKKKRKNS